MKSNTLIAKELTTADNKVQYDEYVKRVLGNRCILAWILKETVEEYKEFPIQEIADCIEPEIMISSVPVRPGETNGKAQKEKEGLFITGDNTEDAVPNEGKTTYDIRFHTFVPQKKQKEQMKLLINLEAQKEFYQSYEIVTRGIFYGARMISAQLDREFTDSHYENLKKVYSIWICMNAPEKIGNALTVYSIAEHDIVGKGFSEKESYDKLSVVVICLNEESEENQQGIHRLLNVLLSPNVKATEKKRILTDEFGIETERELGKEMDEMCNLSEAIEEKGIRKGIEEGEKCFAALTEKLLNAARTEDLLRATRDKSWRESLYKEYGISKEN